MMVLWLLMLRGIGIELRAHIDQPVWQGFFDLIFFGSSTLLAIFFGAALGNVIRGVPLGRDGYFFEPLWTDFRVGAHPGILDWYTVMASVIALTTLTAHGALYMVTKTDGELNFRSRKAALLMWPAQLLLTVVSLIATYSIKPQVMDNYRQHPIGVLIPLTVLASLGAMLWATLNRREKPAFVASALYIASMLVGAAFALYPVVLPASTDPSYSLTIYNSAAAHHGLVVGITWWSIGFVLAVGYFVFIFRMFRGKVGLEGGGY
jgi:cytochrome d ubiquinol oxidase subunit II